MVLSISTHLNIQRRILPQPHVDVPLLPSQKHSNPSPPLKTVVRHIQQFAPNSKRTLHPLPISTTPSKCGYDISNGLMTLSHKDKIQNLVSQDSLNDVLL